MLSLGCSHPSPLFKSTQPKEIRVVNFKVAIFHRGSSSGSVNFRGGRKWWALRRSITRPKCAKTEVEAKQSAQVEASTSGDGGSHSRSFLSVLCPLLKLFGGGDPSRERNEILEVMTSSLSSLARLPWGKRSFLESSQSQVCKDSSPAYLQLYEFEACPFCRRVREAMTELDLTVEVLPCPKGSVRHRQMVKTLGGKEQFPFLVDPNTGISTYESEMDDDSRERLVRKLFVKLPIRNWINVEVADYMTLTPFAVALIGDIVKYLFQQYGQGRNPSLGLIESTVFTGWVPTLLRAGRGMTLWNRARSDPPAKRLELFSYENNPYARIVREALCELELPYILHNVGEGSSKTDSLVQISGSKEVPFLVDNNTGAKLGNYKKILSYLFHTYSTPPES